MQLLPESANKLIDEFSRLPGIGKKTAQRLTFYLLNAKQGYVHDLSDALRDIKIKIKKCTICHGITENDPCMICSSTERDENTLCVVENAYDIFVLYEFFYSLKEFRKNNKSAPPKLTALEENIMCLTAHYRR